MSLTNKNVCYTCVSNQEELKEITHKSSEWDYICLSLTEGVTSNTWDVRYLEGSNSDSFNDLSINQKKAYFKILPHIIFKDYESSIYIDSSIELKDSLNILTSSYCGNSLSVLMHPTKNCIYQEFIECINNSIDDHKRLERQLRKYINEGFPLNYGLYDTSIIYRSHNDSRCILIMNEWINEVIMHSYLDHLSLPYALWKTLSRDFINIIPRNIILSI